MTVHREARSRRKWLVLCSVMVAMAVLSTLLTGCGSTRTAGERPTAGGDDSTPGSEGPAPTGTPALLWAWPSDRELAVLTWDRAAYFRFESPPEYGSLKAEVSPEAPFNLGYAGEIVVVSVEATPGVPYEVTLKTAGGITLGRTYVHLLPQSGFYAEALERRECRYADGRTVGDELTLKRYIRDGDTITAGFGRVVLYMRVPAVTGEKELRDALGVEPSEGAEVFIAPDGQVYHVTIMWPGVEASGRPLPDPVEVSSSGKAPPGFAVTMRVRIDSKKFPAIGEVSGDDGVFEFAVKRTRYAELSIQSLDEPRVRLPLEGFRSVHTVKTGSHRFLLTFSKSVDRGSVERALVMGGLPAWPWPEPDLPRWSFRWVGEDALEFAVSTPLSIPVGELNINPIGGRDKDGLPLSFWPDTQGGFTVRFAEPSVLVRMAVDDLQRGSEKVTDIPPGVTNLQVSPDGGSVLGLEETAIWVSEGYKYYHPWVFSMRTGTWADLGPVVRPFADARWLDGQRLIVRRLEGLAVVDVSSGETVVELPYMESLGYCPSPDGTRVAVLLGIPCPSEWRGASLVIVDLQANKVRRWESITGTDGRDSFLQDVPLVWKAEGYGSEGDVFLVDHPVAGDTRVLRADVESGETSVVDGSQGASRWGGRFLAAFGEKPYVAFVCKGPGEEPPVFKLICADTGVEVLSKPVPDLDPGHPAFLPSPDGRFIVVGRKCWTYRPPDRESRAGSRFPDRWQDSRQTGSGYICTVREGTRANHWSCPFSPSRSRSIRTI